MASVYALSSPRALGLPAELAQPRNRRFRALIPPKIASVSAISGSSTARRMESVLEFYSKLPKGSVQQPKSLNPIARYRQRYFSPGNESGAPIIHAILAIFVAGYTIDYQMHLKHHKNNHH